MSTYSEHRIISYQKLYQNQVEDANFVLVVDVGRRTAPSQMNSGGNLRVFNLFNEGYHGSRSAQTVREELCFEAMRLVLLLCNHPEGEKAKTYALLALFCFHTARLPGRMDDDGALIQLETQDRSTWDNDLIGRGFDFLEKASTGNDLSEYHLEAGIAALHCAASTYEQIFPFDDGYAPCYADAHDQSIADCQSQLTSLGAR